MREIELKETVHKKKFLEEDIKALTEMKSDRAEEPTGLNKIIRKGRSGGIDMSANNVLKRRDARRMERKVYYTHF